MPIAGQRTIGRLSFPPTNVFIVWHRLPNLQIHRSGAQAGISMVKQLGSQVASALVFLSCLGPASVSNASQAGSGTIYGISIEDGKAFFYTNGARTAVPACSTIPGRWVFNAATPNGQAMLSALLSFYSTGRSVAVMGTGACTDWGDTETVRYLIRQEEIG